MHSDRVYWSSRPIDFVLFRLNQGLTSLHRVSQTEFLKAEEPEVWSEIMEEKNEVKNAARILNKLNNVFREWSARFWSTFAVLKTGWASSWQVLHRCFSPQLSIRKLHFLKTDLHFLKVICFQRRKFQKFSSKATIYQRAKRFVS